jgi:hypothetical protein
VRPEHYGLLAELVLVLHVLFVLFVILGLALILVGLGRGWAWVTNPWFRATHLAAIAIVVAQAWAGVLCPLTVWENALREHAGQAGYEGSFVGHWLRALLYYEAEPWVFIVLYTLFAALVVGVWVLAPPRLRRRDGARGDTG